MAWTHTLVASSLLLAGAGYLWQSTPQIVAQPAKLYEVRAPGTNQKTWNLWVRDLKSGNMLIYAGKDESEREFIAVFRARTPREGNEWANNYIQGHPGAHVRVITLTEVGQGFEPPKQRVPGVPENPR